MFKDIIHLPSDSSVIEDIIEKFYNNTQKGYFMMVQRVRANFYWSSMRKRIR